jgi:hypothetical protein
MRAEHFLFLSTLTLYVHAGPARRNCGMETYLTTNNCGVTYGG